MHKWLLATVLLFAHISFANAQSLDNFYPNPPSPYSGFRVGMLHVSGDIIPHMKSYYEMTTPNLTQVGWQFDRKVKDLDSVRSIHLETTAMLSGFEQSIALPSIGAIVNLRSAIGAEVGAGLILAPYGGLALVANLGGIFKLGKKPVPINLVAAVNQRTVAISVRINLFSSALELPRQQAEAQ